MEQHKIEYFRTVSTALCLIRDGCTSKAALAEALELTPIGLADLVEQMEQDDYTFHWPEMDLIIISNAGRRAVAHIELVIYEGQTRFFTRRAAAGAHGRKGLA